MVATATLPDWCRTRAALAEAGGGGIDIVEGLSAISLIGVGINRDTRNVQRAMRVLQEIGAPIHACSTSGFRISIITAQEKLLPAVIQMHRVFVESDQPPLSLGDI